MAADFRVGIAGVAHYHVTQLMPLFAELPEVELVAIADTEPSEPERNVEQDRTRAGTIRLAREELGVERHYDDYREMLAAEKLDIALVFPENARSAQVALDCAAAGAHVLTEKPMAITVAEAAAMRRACDAAGVKLMINWPIIWSPAIRKLRELLDDGAIGDLLQVHVRYGTQGPASIPGWLDLDREEQAATWWYHAADGGGALYDFCSHGACLSRWFFDAPAQTVVAMKANLASGHGSVDDNAAMLARFEAGMAVIEGTWTTHDHAMPHGPILYGSHGTLCLEGASFAEVGQVRLTTADNPQPRFFDGDPLPERDTPAKEFIHHIRTGEPLYPTLDPDFHLDAVGILEAGARSVETGASVIVDDPTWAVPR
jgi:predicted dehydrogenase